MSFVKSILDNIKMPSGETGNNNKNNNSNNNNNNNILILRMPKHYQSALQKFFQILDCSFIFPDGFNTRWKYTQAFTFQL